MNKEIFDRPAKWNSLRYKRVYNHNLFSRLLIEEYHEFSNAKTTIDRLDALADLFFISIGALWKLKVNPYIYLHDRVIIIGYNELKNLNDIYHKSDLSNIMNKILKSKENYNTKRFIAYLIEIIFSEFIHLNCKEEQIELAILIICNSNDTKKVYPLSSNSKGILKGTKYISPHKELSLLAEVIDNEKI